jgi:hypothetical protein
MDSRCNVDMAMLEFDPGGYLGWSAGLDTHIWRCCAREIMYSRCNVDMAKLEFDAGGCLVSTGF